MLTGDSSGTKKRSSSWKPLAFVDVTLGAWFLFLILARTVITCQPGGAPCLVSSAIAALGKGGLASAGRDQGFLYNSPWVDAFVSLVLLGFALWQAARVVFPNEVEIPTVTAKQGEPTSLGPRPVEKSA